tara:strand:+ start:1635 stop:1886 length:252 start_codon:yes stop_codon:yes gene_type:complete
MPLPKEEINDGSSLIEAEALKEEASTQQAIQSESATTPEIPNFGWSAYAERINGRFAMIGFTALLIIELLTNQTFLQWAGFIN